MEVKHDQFIAVYKNVYPEGFCQHLISEFNRLEDSGAGSNRQNSENALKHIKNDHQIFINIKNHSLLPFNNQDTSDLFFDGLQKCYNEYSNVYSVLQNSGNLRCTSMKMQRTRPGGGYHVWHAEQGEGNSANRALVYMLYLNTLQLGENGETEFLYQQQRIAPEENTMILWPAAHTHAHRGNAVFGKNSKYVVTGWFYYD